MLRTGLRGPTARRPERLRGRRLRLRLGRLGLQRRQLCWVGKPLAAVGRATPRQREAGRLRADAVPAAQATAAGGQGHSAAGRAARQGAAGGGAASAGTALARSGRQDRGRWDGGCRQRFSRTDGRLQQHRRLAARADVDAADEGVPGVGGRGACTRSAWGFIPARGMCITWQTQAIERS